jgi:hypothetical protein
MNKVTIKVDANDYVLWAFVFFAIFLVVVLRGPAGVPTQPTLPDSVMVQPDKAPSAVTYADASSPVIGLDR